MERPIRLGKIQAAFQGEKLYHYAPNFLHLSMRISRLEKGEILTRFTAFEHGVKGRPQIAFGAICSGRKRPL